MTDSFQIVGNIKFYEVDGMVCTGNSTQGISLNALVTDVIGSLVIPESINFFGTQKKVELIGNSSFQGCHASSVYIPRFVKEIRRDSFISCSLLKKIVFTENSELYFLGRGFIYNIPKLTHLFIPGSVKLIQTYAFGPFCLTHVYYCGSSEITADVFSKNQDGSVNHRIYVTEQYPSTTFGGIEVQESKFSCYADFYPTKCCTHPRKTSLNINIIFIQIIHAQS
jgi:hypothetical protein